LEYRNEADRREIGNRSLNEKPWGGGRVAPPAWERDEVVTEIGHHAARDESCPNGDRVWRAKHFGKQERHREINTSRNGADDAVSEQPKSRQHRQDVACHASRKPKIDSGSILRNALAADFRNSFLATNRKLMGSTNTQGPRQQSPLSADVFAPFSSTLSPARIGLSVTHDCPI
jgi:hypothetical protein